MLCLNNKVVLAYITGIALGDGNLSNPNGRAVRLRITCDLKYPKLIETIKENLQIIAPNNKVTLVKTRYNCLNISCYSNDWEIVLGWRVGDKLTQQVRVPRWIMNDTQYKTACLRGLLQTDGSMYLDRGYKMINFVNHNRHLAEDVLCMIQDLGFYPTFSAIIPTGSKSKYTVRLVKDVEKFIEHIQLLKE